MDLLRLCSKGQVCCIVFVYYQVKQKYAYEVKNLKLQILDFKIFPIQIFEEKTILFVFLHENSQSCFLPNRKITSQRPLKSTKVFGFELRPKKTLRFTAFRAKGRNDLPSTVEPKGRLNKVPTSANGKRKTIARIEKKGRRKKKEKRFWN